jgi:imidazoleglycerol-phosphate dehydratase
MILGDGFQTEMVREFFSAFSTRGQFNLHATVLYGENTHHKIEALFKGLARALRLAVRVEGAELPSTKGTLTI